MRSNRWISGLALAALALALAPAVHAQPVDRNAPAPGFGTSSRIQLHIGYSAFSPRDTGIPYNEVFTASGTGRFAQGVVGIFQNHPYVPSGAHLTSFELDYCDSSATGHITLKLSECDVQGGNCSTLGTIVTVQGAGAGCGVLTQDLNPMAYTMHNSTRQLLLEATLGSGANTNSLSGAYIGYTLQVSPSPATATFADVPTTSPLSRFVEALVAAGITAGCGGGNYCPATPVTRGQMAVFLATALGLHFPD